MTTQPDNFVTDERRREPIYWFVMLELAIEEGDFAAAAKAVQELRRIGIDVTYRCAPLLKGSNNEV